MIIIFKGDATYDVDLKNHIVCIGSDRVVIVGRKVESHDVPWSSVMTSFDWTIPMSIIKEIKL